MAERAPTAADLTATIGSTSGQPRPGPLVTVIIPTFNEADNILAVLDRVGAALGDRPHQIPHQIVVVDDDSPDLTWRLAELRARADDRITVVRRVGQRGLSSAVMRGMVEADGRVLVVMDADLQHDETKIMEMVSEVVDGDVDVCIASRRADGGGYGSFGRRRRAVSWIGAALARVLLGVSIGDPMSGFFAISRDRFEQVADLVNPRGFKILLEFLARGPEPKVAEIGYQFGTRVNGTTKLSGTVVVDYLRALAGLTVGRVRARVRWLDRRRAGRATSPVSGAGR